MPAKKKDKTLKNPFLLFLLVIVFLHIYTQYIYLLVLAILQINKEGNYPFYERRETDA